MTCADFAAGFPFWSAKLQPFRLPLKDLVRLRDNMMAGATAGLVLSAMNMSVFKFNRRR